MRTRRTTPALALAALLLAAAPAPAEKPPVKIGDPAPGLPRADVDGAKIDPASLRGKVVVVDFWATWCAPCRAQVPQFAALQKKHAGAGLVLIGVSLDEGVDVVRAFRNKYGMAYRVAMGDVKLAERWGGILGLPVAFVVDRQGRVRARHEGEADVPEIEKDVERLLKEK